MTRLGCLFCLWWIAADATAADWRAVAPENLLLLETADGVVTIELNPTFAPKTVAQIRELVDEEFFDGLTFYRVIDGFVAQGGVGEDDEGDAQSDVASLAAEFERKMDDTIDFVTVQQPDLFAPQTGFVDTFAAARDSDTVWLTHCPGVVAMARGNEPDSGSSEFYIVIGQAPRYLDRNLTIFGRVIDGMNIVQRIRRAPPETGGIFQDRSQATAIVSMQLGSDLEEPPRWEVMDSNGEAFKAMVQGRRKRTHEFFHHTPPEVIDVCQVPLSSRRVTVNE